MRHDVYAMYIMIVSIAVIGAALLWLIFYDRKAQRDHAKWLTDLENSRPKYRTWSDLD